MIENVINFLGKYAGPMFSGAFFCLMFYIFYWIFVVAPKKVDKFFKLLKKKGYGKIAPDNKELQDVVTRLTPPHPSGIKSEKVTPWNIKNAIKRKDHNASKYIVLVNRNEAHVGDKGSKKHIKTTLMFIEKKSLGMSGRVYVTPKKNRGATRWEKQDNVTLITNGYESDLCELYNFYFPEKEPVPLPGHLDKALIKIYPFLIRRELFCFNNGVNLMFGPEGWGVCPDNFAYKESTLKILVDMFDTISNSIKWQDHS